MLVRSLVSLVVTACFAALPACGAASDDAGEPRRDIDTTGDDEEEEQQFVRPAACDVGSWIARFSGTVVDADAEPLAEVRVQVCLESALDDSVLCTQPAVSETSGAFVLTVPQSARCMDRAVMRVLLPGVPMATTYRILTLPPEDTTLTLAEDLVLFGTEAPASLPPRGDETLERTVTFTDGLELDVVPADFLAGGVGYEGLAARAYAPDELPAWFVGDHAFARVVAFSPEGDIDGSGFSARLPNTLDLSAGTVVDLYVLGGLHCELTDGSTVPEGAWQNVGSLTVSDDSTHLTGDALPCLTWLAYAQ